MMIINYLKTSLRQLTGNILYSAINIFGLAVGLAACLLISLFVSYELGYDSFIEGNERVYRISPDFKESSMGPARRPAANVAPLSLLIESANFSGVAKVARIGGVQAMLEYDNTAMFEGNLRWVDPAFFDVFTLQWISGDSATALNDPWTIVLSESTARKYFGNEDPVGQILMLENNWPLEVTGVVADLPDNTHLQAELFVNMDTAWAMLDFDYSNNWAYTNFHTYLKLEQGADIATVMEVMNEAVTGDNSMIDPTLAEFFAINEEHFSLSSMRVADIHLYSDRAGEFTESGTINNVLMFGTIAFCLLMIACINFMNLTTARGTQRAREVGTRKAIGADSRSLARQFLGESMLLTVLSMLVAIVLVETLLGVFSAVTDRSLSFSMLLQPGFLAFIILVTVATGLVAGSYPALYLASFKPAKVLKTDSVQSNRTLNIRNTLVVLQFFLAITLIVCTIVVYLQMRYVHNQELGFEKDTIITLEGTSQEGLGAQWEVFKQALLQYPQVESVTEDTLRPGSAGTRRVRIEGGSAGGSNIRAKQVGFGFFETYDIALIEGRYFSEDIVGDLFNPPVNIDEGEQATGRFILNQTALDALGILANEATGKVFEIDFSTDFSVTVSGPVIGVVEDVHLDSLRQRISPMVFYVPTPMWGGLNSFSSASVRINSANSEEIENTVVLIRDTWKQYISDVPFMYGFLQADYDRLYRDEERQSYLFSFFALLTIAIACLGLFGLASFTVERRRKEIGVRKVMGGSVWSIVLLLTNDFSKLVLISNVIAWPVAYYAMNRWLENFAYRIDLTPLIFIGSGLIALCIAWVTVGSTAAKAASQRPVLALRYE